MLLANSFQHHGKRFLKSYFKMRNFIENFTVRENVGYLHYSLHHSITCLVTCSSLPPYLLLVRSLIVLACPFVCPLVVSVCPHVVLLVSFVRPIVLLVILYVGLFITNSFLGKKLTLLKSQAKKKLKHDI